MNFMHFRGPSFTMQVPTNWFITSSPKFQAMFIAPPGPDNVRANLAVSITPVDKDVTVQAVADAAKQTQQKEYPEYSILDEIEMTSADGKKGLRRVYKWYNRDKNMHIVQQQVFYLVSQMLYTITATREEREGMEAIDDMFAQMIASFKFE